MYLPEFSSKILALLLTYSYLRVILKSRFNHKSNTAYHRDLKKQAKNGRAGRVKAGGEGLSHPYFKSSSAPQAGQSSFLRILLRSTPMPQCGQRSGAMTDATAYFDGFLFASSLSNEAFTFTDAGFTRIVFLAFVLIFVVVIFVARSPFAFTLPAKFGSFYW